MLKIDKSLLKTDKIPKNVLSLDIDKNMTKQSKIKSYSIQAIPSSSLEEPLVEYQVIEHSIAGISINDLNKVSAKYDLSINDWAAIMGISTKSIQRYQQQENTLSATQSEFVLKIEQLYKIGNEVFGTTENFKSWLEKPAYGLGYKIPSQILNTISGINLVINQVMRIAHGIFA
jgi:putative toxin-antitoxin system antitoxin component (TIGR02293 family)